MHMPSWFWKWLRRLLGLLLLVGPTPQHIAFIMDGNRRYATQRHMDKIGGHKQGYSKVRAACGLYAGVRWLLHMKLGRCHWQGKGHMRGGHMHGVWTARGHHSRALQ